MIARHGPSQNGDEAGALFRARERQREAGWRERREERGSSFAIHDLRQCPGSAPSRRALSPLAASAASPQKLILINEMESGLLAPY